jgi:hypothetical protein
MADGRGGSTHLAQRSKSVIPGLGRAENPESMNIGLWNSASGI